MLTILYLVATLACAPAPGLGLRLFSMPSSSMQPTIEPVTTLAAYRCAYGVTLPLIGRWGSLRDPARGDLVVFKLPRDGKTDYIKRVIGLPGDKVQMIAGRLSINGAIVPREQVGTYVTHDADGADMTVPLYEETLPNGASHKLIERDGDTGPYDDTAIFEVPPGEYFVLGDNRDNSMDSRMASEQGGVGYVPRANIFAQVLGH